MWGEVFCVCAWGWGVEGRWGTVQNLRHRGRWEEGEGEQAGRLTGADGCVKQDRHVRWLHTQYTVQCALHMSMCPPHLYICWLTVFTAIAVHVPICFSPKRPPPPNTHTRSFWTRPPLTCTVHITTALHVSDLKPYVSTPYPPPPYQVPLAQASPDLQLVSSLAPMWAQERWRLGGGSIPPPPASPPRSPAPLCPAVEAVREEFRVRREEG